MKMKIVSVLMISLMAASLGGCGFFDTLGGLNSGKATSYSDVSDLESGKAYVWQEQGTRGSNRISKKHLD